MAVDNSGYRLRIQRIDNETFMASVVGPGNDTSVLEVLHGKRDYDDQGALTYVVAVVFIYGFTVIFIIASLVKKTRGDHGVSTYMSDLDKIRQLERKQNKKNNVKTILKKMYKEKWERTRDEQGDSQDMPRSPLMLPPMWQGIESSSRQSSNWSLASYREEDEVNYLLAPSTSGSAPPSSPKSPKDGSSQDRQWPSEEANKIIIPVLVPSVMPSSVEVPVIVESQETPYKLNLLSAVPPIGLDTLHEEEEEHTHTC